MKKLKVIEHECNMFFDITSNTKILSFSVLIFCLSPLLCLFLHVIASILDLPLFQQLTNRECFCVSGRRDARSRDRHRWPFGGQQWWRESQQTAGIPLWLCVCVSLCIATHLVSAFYHAGLFTSLTAGLFVPFVNSWSLFASVCLNCAIFNFCFLNTP